MGTNLENIISIVRSHEERIRTEYRTEIIGVFGSHARGQQRRDSDVDVLVRFLEGATLFDLVGLGDLLEENLKVKVDIVSERAVREELRDRILEDVVTIREETMRSLSLFEFSFHEVDDLLSKEHCFLRFFRVIEVS